jgi:hypothetical protein
VAYTHQLTCTLSNCRPSPNNIFSTLLLLLLLLLRQVESDYSLANFGFFLSAWDAQTALDQDLLAGKCLLADQEHKLFTFADRKVRVGCVGWVGRGGG